MKKYIFIGGERTGKSTTILAISHALANLNRNVLVIDTTRSQGIFSCFEYNQDVEEGKKIIRNNCEIIMSNPFLSDFDSYDFEKLKNLDMSIYDYVLIEADQYFHVSILEDAEKIFIHQDGDKHSLLKNIFILEKMNKIEDLNEKLVAVFSSFYDAKFDLNYFLNEFNAKENLIKNNYVEIPFVDEDVINILESKLEGKINMRSFSMDYKAAIYSLANEFENIPEKQFKKLIK